MADLETVVKALECCTTTDEQGFPRCEECPYADSDGTCPDIDAMHRHVLELLKEQKTTAPIVSVDTWICSKCGHTLESQELIDDKENPQVLIHELYQYCPNCGKKVKWE